MAENRETLSRVKKRSRRIRQKNTELNYTFLMITMALLGFGLVMVFSASSGYAHARNLGASHYFARQLLIGGIGIVGMTILAIIPYKFWYHKLVILLGTLVTFVLLVLVLFIGEKGGGAQRWINLGFFQLQPSEIAKFITVVIMAKRLSVFNGDMKKYSSLVNMIAPAVILAALVLAGDHLSGAVIIVIVGIVLVYAAGCKFRHLVYTGLVMLPFLAVAILIKPYRIERVKSFLNPFADTQGSGWQIIQSLYSIGSGGLFGLGLGQSRQKHGFLPEPHTDFIFSVICEELGFFGALLVILLFVFLVVTGFRIALTAPDKFSSLLVCGMISLIAVQVILNIGVVTAAIPCTGITLPFFSYGGSALMVNLAEVGVILNVSRQIGKRRL